MLGGGFSGAALDAAGVVFGQLQLAVAVRSPHHRDVAPDAVESDGAVRPRAFDLRLAVKLQAELGEERDSRVQVVDDDADVVHALNGHVFEHKERRWRPGLLEGGPHASGPGRHPLPGRSRAQLSSSMKDQARRT